VLLGSAMAQGLRPRRLVDGHGAGAGGPGSHLLEHGASRRRPAEEAVPAPLLNGFYARAAKSFFLYPARREAALSGAPGG
jgi:hypothetical protein